MDCTIYFATDHAGFELKNILVDYVKNTLGYTVEDCGPMVFDPDDDYPDFISQAAQKVSKAPTCKAIILGGSGQGEAIVANRFSHVRAAVYYGGPDEIVKLSREHNDANILSLGARFLTQQKAKEVVQLWLETPFSKDERHIRRIKKIEHVL